MFVSRTKRFGAVATVVAALSAVTVLAACSSPSSTPANAAAGASQSSWAKAEGTIVIGAVPDQAGSDSNIKPIEDYVAKMTGYKVEYYPTADYTALIAAAAAGKVDVMSSGALQYVMAINKGANLTPVAAQINSSKIKEPGYYSEAIVPKDSAITSLADAKGKTVCFVDPNSTSGFLFGLYQLHKAGLDVTSNGKDASGNPTFADFKVHFAGAHDKSEQTVASGQCDVGFAEDSIAEAGAQKGEVKVIGKEYVPGGPFSISTGLPADAQKKLTDALQGATPDAIKTAGIATTPGFNSGYFGVQAKTADYYQTIKDLCSQILVAKCSK
ncbi:phosphate/phosphite/phosphonate ABC transporter substrate-binding protein [Arthrobacter methylotrophus]|uniref:Phosphate/phosphite/phosphonate ABC transporter substrate-binding protein n=1 Tax=Arthrobacter methylotrophus TaxID=121291 RepID=A0ABV5UVN7_9MICC